MPLRNSGLGRFTPPVLSNKLLPSKTPTSIKLNNQDSDDPSITDTQLIVLPHEALEAPPPPPAASPPRVAAPPASPPRLKSPPASPRRPNDSALDLGFSQTTLGQRLRTIEEVRALLAGTDISCPGMVVMGAQNAGKSSLLESLSGISFPRGEGMCTRCPTVVSLEVDHTIDVPYVVVAKDAAYTNSTRFALATDRILIRAEMLRLMHVLASNGAVTSSPVYVKIVRREGVTLTMCDLPGITAISADDPHVEEATTSLTEEWAANKNMILLCCMQAQDDFHNSKALQIALRYDPHGLRTIGVVTKCDMLSPVGDFGARMRMERAGDVRLEAHGFIAVRNQTQEEAEKHMSAREFARAERALFTQHPQLQGLPRRMWGVSTLVHKLQALQIGQLDQALPQLAAKVNAQIRVAEAELADLPPAARSQEQQRWKLLDIVNACSMQFHDLVTAADTDTDTNLHIAARSHEMIGVFVERVKARVPSFLEKSQFEAVNAQVGETRGVYLPNFLHGSVFRRVVKQTFEAPLKESAELLVEELAKSVKAALSVLLTRAAADYPALLERLIAIAHAVTDEERTCALTLVREKVDAEMKAPFTLNTQYESLLTEFEHLLIDEPQSRPHAEPGSFPATPQSRPHGEPGSSPAKPQSRSHAEPSSFPADFIVEAVEDVRARAEAAMIRRLQVSLYSYQLVLQNRLFDCIPMDVRHRVMYQLHERLAPTLLRETPNLLHLLADEKPGVAERRNEIEALLRKLRAAGSLIANALATSASGATVSATRV